MLCGWMGTSRAREAAASSVSMSDSRKIRGPGPLRSLETFANCLHRYELALFCLVLATLFRVEEHSLF